MSQIKQEKKGFFNKFLDFIEVGGNKLPHPVTLFVLFCLTIIIVSGITEKMGVSATYNALNKKTGNFEEITVTVKSLTNAAGIRYIVAGIRRGRLQRIVRTVNSALNSCKGLMAIISFR